MPLRLRFDERETAGSHRAAGRDVNDRGLADACVFRDDEQFE